MAFIDTISAQRSRSLAMSGLLCVLILTLLSLLSVNVFSYHIAFGFLPLIGVFLWPRMSDPMISVLGLFGVGLFADLLGETPLGFWAFVYLSYFMIFRPDRRETSAGLLALWLGFVVAVIVAGIIMIGISMILVGQRANLLSLVLAWLPVIAVFPFVFWSLRAIGRKSADGSGSGFVT